MSPFSRSGRRSAIDLSTTAAGTISQIARGFASFFDEVRERRGADRLLLRRAPRRPSGDMSKTTHSWPPPISRRTMFAPIRPESDHSELHGRAPSPVVLSGVIPPSSASGIGGSARSWSCRARARARPALSSSGTIALGEHLPQLDAPLVERVDVPDGALREDAVLVERDELAERLRREPSARGSCSRGGCPRRRGAARASPASPRPSPRPASCRTRAPRPGRRRSPSGCRGAGRAGSAARRRR